LHLDTGYQVNGKVTYAVLWNTRQGGSPSPDILADSDSQILQTVQSIQSWPSGDLFPQYTDRIPTALVRDISGGIHLSTYALPALSNAGGAFASDPSAAQDAYGNTFVAARDSFNAIWANVFNTSSQTWWGWQFGGGVIQGVPGLAVAPN